MHGSTWTSTDTEKLIALWPTHTAGQISRALGKTRSAICGRAFRLGLPGTVKHLDHDPHQGPPPRELSRQVVPLPPSPPEPAADRLAMKPCTIGELEAGRCKWPLGDLAKVSVMFCGGVTAPGRDRRYCSYHQRIAARDVT